ncbi:MAG: hypothetical protein ABW032_02020 [Burkholderiaceae bacterium]
MHRTPHTTSVELEAITPRLRSRSTPPQMEFEQAQSRIMASESFEQARQIARDFYGRGSDNDNVFNMALGGGVFLPHQVEAMREAKEITPLQFEFALESGIRWTPWVRLITYVYGPSNPDEEFQSRAQQVGARYFAHDNPEAALFTFEREGETLFGDIEVRMLAADPRQITEDQGLRMRYLTRDQWDLFVFVAFNFHQPDLMGDCARGLSAFEKCGGSPGISPTEFLAADVLEDVHVRLILADPFKDPGSLHPDIEVRMGLMKNEARARLDKAREKERGRIDAERQRIEAGRQQPEAEITPPDGPPPDYESLTFPDRPFGREAAPPLVLRPLNPAQYYGKTSVPGFTPEETEAIRRNPNVLMQIPNQMLLNGIAYERGRRTFNTFKGRQQPNLPSTLFGFTSHQLGQMARQPKWQQEDQIARQLQPGRENRDFALTVIRIVLAG